jgi:hypothetical protein
LIRSSFPAGPQPAMWRLLCCSSSLIPRCLKAVHLRHSHVWITRSILWSLSFSRASTPFLPEWHHNLLKQAQPQEL